MKSLLILCALSMVVLALGDTKTHSRGCYYIDGRCFRDCEEGTNAYAPGCGPIVPEPTCDKPNPVAGREIICDYSDCYCDPPTVRDTVSKKCVPKEECPKSDAKGD